MTRPPIDVSIKEIRFGTASEDEDLIRFIDTYYDESLTEQDSTFWNPFMVKVLKGVILHVYYMERTGPEIPKIVDLLYNIVFADTMFGLNCYPHITKEELFGKNPLQTACGEYVPKDDMTEIGKILKALAKRHKLEDIRCGSIDDVVSAITAIEKYEPLNLLEPPFLSLFFHPAVIEAVDVLNDGSDVAKKIIVSRAISLLEQKSVDWSLLK